MADVQQTPQQMWVAEIAAAEKECKKFHERGSNVNKRYIDERDVLSATNKWFNIFYANTNILTAALYAQIPKPMVGRRFKDFDDEVGRVAGMILQRCITQDLDDPRDTFDSTMKQCVQDRLVPGLGQAWLRLETDTSPIEGYTTPPAQPNTDVPPAEPMQEIVAQRVCVDYVYWKDFIWSPCRIWAERRWVGRRVYMDRNELIERFGKVKGEAVPLDYSPVKVGNYQGQDATPQDETVKKAAIFEIWVRATRKVFWVSKSHPEILDEKDDPLQLTGFEPCPTPMLANITTSNTTPRPDYYMLQDQYNELDTLNNRISMLVRACKVVGVYDKGAIGIARMLKEGFDNDLIPVDNWAMFAEKGGIKGQVDWLPLEVVVAALGQLQLAREATKQQIYELTGIADIVRGASKASETLGAQEIKAKFASVRIKKLQDEVATFAAEILRIKAEIMCKHFDPQLLLEISNVEMTPDGQDPDLIYSAIKVLTNQQDFEWRITVTADSIAQADYDMEKKDRVEFLTAVSSYLEKASQMFQAVPQSAELLVGMLKWAVAGFKGATEIEGMLDKALDGLTKNPPENKPDPEQQKMQMEQQKMQQEAQIEQGKAQQEMQMEQMRLQMEQQREQMRLQMEQQANEQKLAMERELGQLKIWLAQMLANIKVQGAQQQHEQQTMAREEEHQLNMQTREQESQLAIETMKKEAAAAPKNTGDD